jgi:hypothetical protein
LGSTICSIGASAANGAPQRDDEAKRFVGFETTQVIPAIHQRMNQAPKIDSANASEQPTAPANA